LDINYNDYVSLLGTAHFTRRSLLEAYDAVERLKPTDLAIELDLQRFQLLNRSCLSCAQRERCSGRCEFIGATDALGNVDANIWLIDMSERQIAERIQRFSPSPGSWWFSFVSFPIWEARDDEVDLWEKGLKNEVLKRHDQRLEILKMKAPHVWRVLIDDRNALMAARLSWIVTQELIKNKHIAMLALTGAAHVNGISKLLSSPAHIKEELRRSGLNFTPPRLIRRVRVN
jgi:pheromone shutdown protein TraB